MKSGSRHKTRSRYSRDNFRGYLKSSLADVYEFYTPANRRKKAESLWVPFRFAYKSFWFLNGVSKKLRFSRYRWILITISIVLFMNQSGANNNPFAFIILFFVLLLEIRDKLLAHEELQAGNAIQNALMPEQQPDVPGWDVWLYSQPARLVGGDYIDIHPFADKCCGLAIGDVSGKGLAAALLMAKLQASVEALIPHTPDIAEMTAKLNDLFCKPSLKSQFISFLYIKINPSDNEICFVNAGHLPPWIIRDGALKELSKGDPALGLRSGQRFQIRSETLRPGNALIALTDGCTEIRNESGHFIDEHMIQNHILEHADKPAHEIGNSLLKHIIDFRADRVQHDDMTLMVLKRK
ncbi:MAG: SpoIIE family protein phosphatase [candidate division KSB1 bacterium]|nr:SpoIIE family protein phosphatase [candidate division KSB1 bacterium]